MKYYLYLILILALPSLTCCGQINNNQATEKHNYTLIENYTNLQGFQYLTADSSFNLSLTKMGYTIYLPKGNVRGTLVYPGVIPDSTIKNDALKIIEPDVVKNIAVIYLSTGKEDWLFSDEETKSLDSILNNALVKCNLKEKPIFL